MTKIYLIDDEYRRHQQLNVLVEKLNAEPPTAEYECDVCPSDQSEAIKHATKSILSDNVWTAVSTAIPGSIFLLDLKLGDLEENQAWESLQEKLIVCSDDWSAKAQDLLKDLGSSTPHKTAAFACAVLLSRGIDVILISTAAFQDARTIRESLRIPIAVSSEGEDWPAWKDEILKLRRHGDPVIRGILRAYFDPILNNSKCWLHGLDSFDEGQFGKGIWGLEEIDDTTNKALHCRGENWTPLENDQGSITWKSLQKAVSALKCDCPVEHVGLENERFYLPIKPGIMFLLSLRELLVAMTSDHGQTKTRAWPKAIKFGRTNKLMFISIELATSESSEATIQKRFLGKLWKDYKTHNGTISNRIPDGGLSESIFHLGHARLGGINGNEPWSMMFNDGSKEWVAWPSFQNDSITFHWHI